MPDSDDVYVDPSELADELQAYVDADSAQTPVEGPLTKSEVYRERVSTDRGAREYARELIDAVVHPENKEMVRYAASEAAILACILRASGYYPDPDTGKQVWGGGIEWALQACVVRPWSDEQPPEDEDSDVDLTTPSWKTAYLRLVIDDNPTVTTMALALSLNGKTLDTVMVRLARALTKEFFA
ncbi:MAG: hypothetical protein WAU30_13340 [Propionicimonas sp.]